jgi:hypothetical protein
MADGGIGVDFIDILFGLVVTEIFTAFTSVRLHEYATWAGLSLSLVLVVFSWIGYHKAKKAYGQSISFKDVSIVLLFVDIAIVGIYLALVKQIEHTEKLGRGHHPVLSIRPEAATLLVVFGLYLVWDLFQIRLSTETADTDRAKGHALRSFLFLIPFGAYSAAVIAIWKPNTNGAIVLAYVIYVAFCYLYRRLPDLHRPGSSVPVAVELL